MRAKRRGVFARTGREAQQEAKAARSRLAKWSFVLG